jgi:uncharacterized protein (UPF0332 family)
VVPAGNGSAGGRGDDMNQDKDKEILIRYRMDQAHSALKEAVFLREKSDTTLGAVNRSNYAMLALLQRIEKVPRKHSGAIALFDSEFVRKGIFPKALSTHLHRAFAFRQDSDYHAIKPVSLEDTDELIRNASSFVETIRAYLKGSAEGQET